MQTNWHVITGGPGTGKTVLINLLRKHGYHTVPEAATEIIDEGLAQGKTIQDIRGDEHEWQANILQRALQKEAATPPNQLTFFDRGTHDGLAHLHYYNLTPRSEWNDIKYGNPYKTVFLLEPLGDVAKEYNRIENIEFTRKITGVMRDVYRQAGTEPIMIPALPPEERVKLILEHIGL
ncbi:MAG TPA: ATP-binding protein [Candidatus Saccharimonadales bacterium]|nr:ATP-binding protein [Candidatus Saccharimonadales bacterium]